MPLRHLNDMLNDALNRMSRSIWPKASQLSDAVYIELVHLLYAALLPVIFMAIAATGVGALIFVKTGDTTLLGLIIACALVSLSRVLGILAFRRRAAQGSLTRAEASYWEFRYALGSFMFAILLGALGYRALDAANPLVPMLVTGIMFGYGAGVVSRHSIRPIICVGSLAFAAVPVVSSFALHSEASSGFFGSAAFATQAFLVAGFALASLETVAHTYRTTLTQLHTKQDFAALAGHDSLTGLPNRMLLRSRFVEGASSMRRSGDLMAVLCLDLDKFKPVNDTYGHPVGDILLHAVGQRLARTLQAGDTAARVGGDEFVVLQNGIRSADEARLLAHRIIRVVTAPYSVNGHEIRIGICIGIAVNENDGLELDQLIARADAALYQAKRERTSQLVFWEETATQPAKSSAA